MKTLVLGGYGNFGARICRALSGDTAITLVVGGRDLGKARKLVDELGGDSAATPMALDHARADFAERLHAAGIELVIHAAGPFQDQGYGVARAAAAAGAHYIDLADGRRFVCDFQAALDASFRAAGRTAISGASTVPALSSAVVDHLCSGWQAIDSIDICIAPAQTAPRGRATLAAVLGYCGAPLRIWEGGRWITRAGWANPETVSFARLSPRLGALCDIPDLELFPTHYRARQRVMFRAALEVALTQRVFAGLAALCSRGIFKRPERLAGMLDFAAPGLDFLGSALGGMVVRVEGCDAAGKTSKRAWHLTADNDKGPEIPCMAAILLARKIAHGAAQPVGARACMSQLGLAEFEPEFARYGMVTDVVEELAGSMLTPPPRDNSGQDRAA
ncbi:MAG: saccharopine dehydrogenase [Comamonadaceae bacterium]|nr:MAG: saccharopine dehydrogenase [Comamonadaceae bacterium]